MKFPKLAIPKKKLFDKYHAGLITGAVDQAESMTDAEIVVRVVREAWDKDAIKRLKENGGDPATIPNSPGSRVRARAEAEFNALGIDKTEHGHGVLILVSVNEKCVDILADPTIVQAMSHDAQDMISEAGKMVIEGYKTKTPAEGIVSAVKLLGEKLSVHFPKTVGDKNELCNNLIQD